MVDFVRALDRVNAEADAAPGFVWRLQTADGDSTGIRIDDDPTILFNLSVWESLDALLAYTYRSDHGTVFRRRREWFREPERETVVMWWVPQGDRPTVADGVSRLERLWAQGPTPDAFSFREAFSSDGLPLHPGWRREAATRRGAREGPPSP